MGLVDEVRRDRTTRMPSPRTARAIRVAAGVTQEQIASELGVSRVAVTAWELGRSQPRRQNRRAYAELLAQLSEAVSA